MGSARRIIPCLDIDGGRVVKGVRFVDIRDAGDPVEIARRYAEAGADELTLLNISAVRDGHEAIARVVEQLARETSIPLIVGGGIGSVADVRRMLDAGADKVSISSAAVRRPQLVEELAAVFGSRRLVVAIDAKRASAGQQPARWEVFAQGGRKATGLDAVDWAQRMVAAGAGELLLTSMDRDGTKQGFDNALNRAVAEAVPVPVIASGGVGNLQHLVDGIAVGKADAVLAASIFHYGEYTIEQAKRYLAEHGIEVRL